MDTYSLIGRCINRLVDEWVKYGKIVIGVDFDDTIYDFHNQGSVYDDVIELLRNVSGDAHIFCHTASHSSRYQDISDRFSELGIPLYGINVSPVLLHDEAQSKPYANIYIDDRAGLYCSMSILKTAHKKYKQLKGGE